MGITIKEKPQSFGCLQNHVPAFCSHTHIAHSHRQGHSLTVHGDLWSFSQAHNLVCHSNQHTLGFTSLIFLKHDGKVLISRF
jgi:hypothetical protein